MALTSEGTVEGLVVGRSSETWHRGEFERFKRALFRRWLVKVGLVIVVTAALTAIFAPLLAPDNPYAQNLGQRLQAPSQQHLLGTDVLGRDTLSRVVYGARASLMVGVVALLFSSLIGTMMGLIAGYFGGMTYAVIMRFVDALMAFPPILLGLVIAGLLGGGLHNVILAVGISLIPQFARLMCAQVLSVRENDYVMAARTLGAKNLRVMLRHVVPNSFPPLIVQISLWMGFAILTEAALSFLGVGIQPPEAAWGAMISDGYKYLLMDPVLSVAPGAAIMLVVFGFNMIGDGLRDALDPRLRSQDVAA